MRSSALDLVDTVGFATTSQLLAVSNRKQVDALVNSGLLIRVWRGVYTTAEPDTIDRLRALDIFLGIEAVACLGTAAKLYGFDTENTVPIHVLDPGTRLRPTVGLMVHQRLGAPLQRVAGRMATTPAWTAVEVARHLYQNRPRALATLDAALHSTWCTPPELASAIHAQRGRRGIAEVRRLLAVDDGRAESAMESEARLAMLDSCLPKPELQYKIHGSRGEVWRVDFAWPEARVCAEYESVEWHAGRDEMLRDKRRFAGVQEVGWVLIPIVVSDVRDEPQRFADRIAHHLQARSADTNFPKSLSK